MWKRILAVLLLIPLLDGLLLIVVADLLGWQLTVLLVVLTALLGMLFARAEGRRTLRGIETQLRAGEPPTGELLDAGLVIAAAAFLLTPGLVTDGIGFVLLIPPSRWAIRKALTRWVLVPYFDRRSGGFITGNVYTFGFPGDRGDEPETITIDSDNESEP